MEDTFNRFSRVVQNYVHYRPRYPDKIIDWLNAECGLENSHIVADIGSGTGLLAKIFLKNGNQVIGVEPNMEMRSAAQIFLREHPRFRSIEGTAEATTLRDKSVQFITAGQAFHWFKLEPTRQEFLRILNPGGWVVLVWNLFRNNGTPFSDAFEMFWLKYIDSRGRFNERKRPETLTHFFGGNVLETSLDNYQVCDFEMLTGRALSASSSPEADDPRYQPMLDELRAIFDRYQEDGKVILDYDTRVIYGQLS